MLNSQLFLETKNNLEKIGWQNDMRSGLKNKKELEAFLNCKIPETPYQFFIPKKLALKIKKLGPESVLWKQFIPSEEENNQSLQDEGLEDPIGDKAYQKPGQLIHRYKNRVLFLPTEKCPVYCRYCFRKNELGRNDDLFHPEFEKSLAYLNTHPEINEVIFSGGDPLILSDKKIFNYLKEFSKIPSIKYIRLHTRVPMIIPGRINDDFLQILKFGVKSFSSFALSIHLNHLDEIDSEVEKRIEKLQIKGLTLLSQTVLLNGINDTPEDLKALFYKLIELKIRPYYLHHPDQVKGGMHFYVPLKKGREIYSTLHNSLPGWAVPQYVIDIPGGEGKVSAFNPENLEFSGQLISKSGKYFPLDIK